METAEREATFLQISGSDALSQSIQTPVLQDVDVSGVPNTRSLFTNDDAKVLVEALGRWRRGREGVNTCFEILREVGLKCGL